MSASDAKRSTGANTEEFTKVGERELTIVRTFNAPRKLVFEAWTKPEHLSRWFGPKGFTVPSCEVDFRAGGVFRFVLRGPDGKDYPFDGSYVEVVELERIVFRGDIHDVPGQDVLTTVTFADHQGKTKVTVHQTYACESDATRGAPIGWNQTLDRLADFVTNR
jgi:uncharacterized protein YndB with AHSA1/START domain